MKATKEIVKAKLAKNLTSLNGRGFYQIIADRVGCSSETVRLWFTIPERVNSEIEDQAFLLYDELKKANEEKLRKLES